MKLQRTLAAVVVALAAGCGCVAPGDDGGTDAGGAVPPPDLARGTWQRENVSHRPDTISHDGALTFSDDGTAWIAWAEPNPQDSSDQDIWTGRRGGDGWQTQPFTSDDGLQNAFPRLVAMGAEAHLVYSSNPGGGNHVYYAQAEGGGDWNAPVDLTGGGDAAGPRRDYAPGLAVAASGELLVGFLSVSIDGGGASTGSQEVRLLRFSDPTAPGDPAVVIAPVGEENCEDVSVAVDGSGHAHVVASCGPIFEESVRYATDAAGGFTAEMVPMGDADVGYSPGVVVGKDGETVHVVWVADLPCAPGQCADIMLSTRRGGSFGAPTRIAPTDEDDEVSPVIAVDGGGRVLVVYQRYNAASMADLFFSWSADGSSFSEELNITPGTDDSDEWMPWTLTVDPTTQAPNVTYTAILNDSDPLDTEVMRAWFVPEGA